MLTRRVEPLAVDTSKVLIAKEIEVPDPPLIEKKYFNDVLVVILARVQVCARTRPARKRLRAVPCRLSGLESR